MQKFNDNPDACGCAGGGEAKQKASGQRAGDSPQARSAADTDTDAV